MEINSYFIFQFPSIWIIIGRKHYKSFALKWKLRVPVN
jgi:hypothetical protein